MEHWLAATRERLATAEKDIWNSEHREQDEMKKQVVLAFSGGPGYFFSA